MKISTILNLNSFSFLIVFLVISIGRLPAQIEPDNRNAVYVTGGTTIFLNQASLAYERTFIAKEKAKTNGKVILGTYLTNGLDFEAGERKYKNYLGVSAVQQISFVELNLGVVYANYTLAGGVPLDAGEDFPMIDTSKVESSPVLYAGGGIRYETGGFLLRAGINNLELLYFGLGVTF